jgi:hypothetical protein
MASQPKTTDRYFSSTADQLRRAAAACRAASRHDDDDWDALEAAEARRLTAELDWSWDFEGWAHAASILENEAALAD